MAMLEHLFGSKTRVKLLRLVFRDPGRTFFVRELARTLDVQVNAIRRELEALMAIGLLRESEAPATADVSIEAGEHLRKYYALDQTCLVYAELQALVLKEQVMGEQEFVNAIKEKIGSIRFLLLTGRFTRDERALSDILLVGAIKERALAKLVSEYEKEFGFPIRYTIMTEQEFFDRRYIMDKFLFSLFESNHIKLINELEV